jgi:hypothetical protein
MAIGSFREIFASLGATIRSTPRRTASKAHRNLAPRARHSSVGAAYLIRMRKSGDSHSQCNAIKGSARAARSAGMEVATSEIRTTIAALLANATGSFGRTP